tara:strand:- start:29 stop:325 length:297 start_codon:yes stop_codon:yes gene_type:complete
MDTVIPLPPRDLWLEHDFMLLSLNEMKTAYRVYRTASTLCDDDVNNLAICYQIKKAKETMKDTSFNMDSIKEIKQATPIKIPYMKKAKRRSIRVKRNN